MGKKSRQSSRRAFIGQATLAGASIVLALRLPTMVTNFCIGLKSLFCIKNVQSENYRC
ncbi:twin-arginine translocation signal domain-containing protein [Chitinophaga filiformis]|uniref:twin-arginine translocation signal domain-containing protein n=1 Tax=Chitinophaga filiformis TaxID=104663 RepID=UPI000B7EA6E5